MEPALYDRIGIDYNTTRKADPYLCSRLHALLQPRSGLRYLDVGSGTGNYTIALSELGLDLTGLDPSEEMLGKARSRSSSVIWVKGKAEELPFEDMSFNGVVGTLTLHHWQNMEQGFKELYRVCTPGSRLVFLTSTPQQMEGYWLNHYFPVMLRRSCEVMPSEERVNGALEAAGFMVEPSEKYFVKDDLQDLFLHAGKNAPEMYFDERIRKGISTFANLGIPEELSSGLEALRYDLDTGLFNAVKKQYDNELGDYLFVTAIKN